MATGEQRPPERVHAHPEAGGIPTDPSDIEAFLEINAPVYELTEELWGTLDGIRKALKDEMSIVRTSTGGRVEEGVVHLELTPLVHAGREKRREAPDPGPIIRRMAGKFNQRAYRALQESSWAYHR